MDIDRRSLLRLGSASVVAPLVMRGHLAPVQRIFSQLSEPTTTATYDAGTDGTAVPVGDGVLVTMGAPIYSGVDALHGSMGWLSSAEAGGGRLVYANPAAAASSGSIYLRPHAIAPYSAATVVALLYDAISSSSAAKVRLTAEGRVEILDTTDARVAYSKLLWTPEQKLRLDWQQVSDGATLALTVWVFADANAEGWRPTGVLQATFPSPLPTHVALGQEDNATASIGFDTYRAYASSTVPAPFAPVVGAVAIHSYDDGIDGAPLLLGEDMVTGVTGKPRYGAAAALHGPLGVLLPLSGCGILRYDNPHPPASTGSLYARTIDRGRSDSRLVTLQSGATVLANIKLSRRGAVCIVSPQGAVLAVTPARAPLKSWARIDWQSIWDGVELTLRVRYFSTSAESPDNYTEIGATVPAVATPHTLAVGSASMGWKIYLDTLRTYGDVSAWPEPVNPDQAFRTPGTAVWAGDATQTSVEISGYSNGTTSVGLVISASADMSDATSWPAAPPNASGWNKWSITGLAPGTEYHHQLTDTPDGSEPLPVSGISRFRTLQPTGAPCVTRIAVGSCGQTAPMSTAAFDDIVAWKPDRVVHLGDFGYPNELSRNPATHMNNWSLNCTDLGIQAVQAIACMDYVISDHDDNGTGTSNVPTYNDPITMANLIAWQQAVPARMEDTQSPPHGRWRADVEGNVRFVKLDTRSIDKTDNTTTSTDPRSPASTMLGAAQLAWLKGQLDAAALERQLVIVFTDPAWNGSSPGPPIPVTFCDKWPSYVYERDLISDHAAALGVHLFIVFGDSHGLQQDDGTSERNGFATICCGPFDQELHMHYQDSYQWSYPEGIVDAGGPYRAAQQYQRLTISQEPDSSTVTVTAEARDCSPAVEGTPFTARTMTKTYTL